MKLTPTIARNLTRCLQDVMPVIMKKIIIINAPTYMELVINLLKPFAKGKLIEKFQIHSGGPEVLEKYFPRDLLPSDYGGKEDSIDALNKAWYGVLQQYRGWLLKEGSATVDENKRPRHSKSRGLQELQGSFKTLCVD